MKSFNNEDTFFELTQKAEQEEKDQHLQKCRVIHLWGAAYYILTSNNFVPQNKKSTK